MALRSSPDSDGERLTATSLQQRGWKYDYEPEIGGRHPDFIAETEQGTVVMEVFEPNLRVPSTAGAIDSIEPVLGLFESRRRAKIAAVKAAGLPLVIGRR